MESMKSVLSPYLNFNGNTAEAMKFYKSALGGELEMQTFGESGMPCSSEDKDKIMHATLKHESLSFMASDGHTDHTVMMGNNIHMSISGTDEKQITEWFNKLAVGGKINMPLAKQFWGDTFGMLTDKFGINWMVNIGSEKK